MNQFLQWLADLVKGMRPWLVVLPWERAVRIRLGKHTALLGPGWHLRIPFLDEVRTVNTRLRLTSFPSLTVTTKDGKTVTAAGLIGFRVADPLRAMLALQEPENTCGGLAMCFMSRYLTERRFADVSTADAEAAAVQALADQAPGVQIEFVRLIDFASVKTFRFLQEQWRPGTSRVPDGGL